MEFKDLQLDEAILRALDDIGYKAPSPIQEEAIPPALAGKDLIAVAQTGSGKTAACAIPLCQKVDITHTFIQALVVVPTRELALQYATETQKIGKRKGVKTFAIFGGEDFSLQEAKLKHGVHILIATPGRLIDFIYSRLIDLSQVNCLVLDEADEMLSMGFYDDLEFIIQCLVHEHQTLLFSATMPPKIRAMAKGHMIDPVEITLTKVVTAPANIDHHFCYCQHQDRDYALVKLLKKFHPKQSIIFCHTRVQVEKLSKVLQKAFPAVDHLHGALPQELRRIITSKYRSGKIKHLVATNVAARGLDFSNVSHVFIYQISDDPDVFLHRSGRTGRFEKEGTVVTLVTKRELSMMPAIVKALNKEPVWIGDPPPPMAPPLPKKRRRAPYRNSGEA